MITARKLALCLVLAGAALPVSNTVWAASRHAVAAGEAQVRQLLTLMDTDQNGMVSRAEFMRFMEAEFEALDIDHNGELDPGELAHTQIWAAGAGRVEQLLRLMDKDRNGKVSRAEYMRFMEAEFNRLDVDRSGELSPQELSHTILRANPTHVSPHR